MLGGTLRAMHGSPAKMLVLVEQSARGDFRGITLAADLLAYPKALDGERGFNFGLARNFLLRHIRTPYVTLMDCGVIVPRYALLRAIEVLAALPPRPAQGQMHPR